MASMWKPLLAATLAVGRNTRLLTVGSSILAINAPMVEGQQTQLVDEKMSFGASGVKTIKYKLCTLSGVLKC